MSLMILVLPALLGARDLPPRPIPPRRAVLQEISPVRRIGVPAPPALLAPAPGAIPTSPAPVSGQCDSLGCTGSNGTRYTGPVGGVLQDPAGRPCTLQGGFIYCQ
ncbi:hypothetical protein [Massilia sp. TS11]|uniref:hypothetical protein n=1 Tax=Massilia sp. TS11 TaxID=2908003 RepID=UPI001EDC413F|nr:hypothetical protein [Massilia sp. TS11]MCG2585543.1 hypothetical protein [Massilia sp. TS11]